MTYPSKNNSHDPLEKILDRVDDHIVDTTKTIKKGCIAAGVGAVIGAAGGLYFGITLNDYVDALKDAPVVIRGVVDGASMIAGGWIGAYGGALSVQLTYAVRTFRRIFK